MPFRRSDEAAAREFVDSVFSAGGARVGRGAKHPSTWSRDYTLRVANVWQRQAAAGRVLSLQEARRGPRMVARVRAEQEQALSRGKVLPGGLEHPRARWVGPRETVRGRERPDEGGAHGFYARQYRRASSAERFTTDRLAAERMQVLAYGTLTEGYGGGATTPQWRILYTGPRDEAPWDLLDLGYHADPESAISPGEPFPMFDRVERFEIRWGPYYGD